MINKINKLGSMILRCY